MPLPVFARLLPLRSRKRSSKALNRCRIPSRRPPPFRHQAVTESNRPPDPDVSRMSCPERAPCASVGTASWPVMHHLPVLPGNLARNALRLRHSAVTLATTGPGACVTLRSGGHRNDPIPGSGNVPHVRRSVSAASICSRNARTRTEECKERADNLCDIASSPADSPPPRQAPRPASCIWLRAIRTCPSRSSSNIDRIPVRNCGISQMCSLDRK